MFVDHMLCAIDGAQTTELGRVASDISRAYANGAIGEGDYQRLWEAIDARRAGSRTKSVNSTSFVRSAGSQISAMAPISAIRKRRHVADIERRRASIARRRLLAASGPMPPHLAAHFTQGELAALRVIGDECRARGCCGLHIDAIAARAGVGRTTVQNAIRRARRLGLVDVRERRRRGQKSLTNIVRIISAEWRLWLARGSGFKKSSTTDKVQVSQGFGAQWRRHYRPYDPTESNRTRLVGAKLSQGSKAGQRGGG